MDQPGVTQSIGFTELLRAFGALMVALSIGLSAYAAHATLAVGDVGLLQTAALYVFGQGVALAALAPERRVLCRIALLIICFGTWVFAGSLVGKALFEWPAHAAPIGGIAMMVGWLLYAVGAVRR